MLTSPPIVLLSLALIYSLYAAYQLRRIHSAQIAIEGVHAVSEWKIYEKEYASNAGLIDEYALHLWCVVWIVACCGVELGFGYYTSHPYWDHGILCVGSVIAAFVCLINLEPIRFPSSAAANPSWPKLARILVFSAIYGFQWELAACGACLYGITWYVRQPVDPA